MQHPVDLQAESDTHPVFLHPGAPFVLRMRVRETQFWAWLNDEAAVTHDLDLVASDLVRVDLQGQAEINFAGIVEQGNILYGTHRMQHDFVIY